MQKRKHCKNPSIKAVAEKGHKDYVYVKLSVWNEMIRHCKNELPYEACGLLSGRKRKLETIWKMDNIEKSAYSFAMDLDQITNTIQLMEKRKESLTGIYHSHPTGLPYPSKEDILNAHYPKAAYFIVSLANQKPIVRCFRIQDKSVYPLLIKVINE
ncbi:M67 family metallopeptidase [Bacillus aquiflavi]|nr:M67 family metallopeptidase [Bacillus aquiflavi]